MSNEAINWAFAASIPRSADKLVLLAIADAANENWACFPGKDEIARKASCAKTSVVHCTRRLEEGGFLVRVPFEAPKGQDQKIGYVLAGGGRLGDLDEDFLRKAFALRKLDGTPRTEKPPHWSGARKGEQPTAGQGDQTVTLPGQGDQLVTPRGDQTVTPRTQSRSLTKDKDFGAAAASSRALDADASSMGVEEASPPPISDDASASSGAAGASPRRGGDIQQEPKKPKRETLDRRLDRHLEELGPDVIDDMLCDLENDRGSIAEWATRKACTALDLELGADPHDEPGGRHARKAVGLALMRLRKAGGGGITPYVEELLGWFDWPPERAASARPRTAAEPRPYTVRLPYAKGVPAEKVLAGLYAGIDDLAPDARGLMGTEFLDCLPGIFRNCENAAREHLAQDGGDSTPDQLLRLTLMYGQRHYSGKRECPVFLVPGHLRPKADASKTTPHGETDA